MAIQGYAAVENAFIALMLTKFPDELDADLLRAGDLDKVLDALFQGDGRYGCLLEYGGGRPDLNDTFKTTSWIWAVDGVFMIRYDPETIEADLRAIVTKLAKVFELDHTLSGAAKKARVTVIESPEVVHMNDVPFYWITFSVEIWDR